MDIPLHCRSCGHVGTRACPGETTRSEFCGSYLCWSEHWAQEVVTIERALRNTYIAAACFAALVVLTILLPNVIV